MHGAWRALERHHAYVPRTDGPPDSKQHNRRATNGKLTYSSQAHNEDAMRFAFLSNKLNKMKTFLLPPFPMNTLSLRILGSIPHNANSSE